MFNAFIWSFQVYVINIEEWTSNTVIFALYSLDSCPFKITMSLGKISKIPHVNNLSIKRYQTIVNIIKIANYIFGHVRTLGTIYPPKFGDP